jgi:polyisoprenoid-binding protein YceI
MRGPRRARPSRARPRPDPVSLASTSWPTVIAMTDTTTTAPPLAPGIWTLDPMHSEVGFTIRHLGISKVRGAFRQLDAELVVGATLAESSLTATVAVASVDTGNPDRDAHLLTPDLLDVERRPTLHLRSTAITDEGDGGYRLEGDLTIGDVTRPVTLHAEFGGLESFPMDGSTHAGFEATGELRRSDFGIAFGPLDAALGNGVKIAIDVQLVARSE